MSTHSPAVPDGTRLTIIHTNDTHGTLARPGVPAAAGLGGLLNSHAGALYLDAGDSVSAGNLGVNLAGEPALGVLSGLGCAAMTLGNRETHPRKEIFPRKVRDAGFPLLCANIRSKGDAPNPTVPHVVLDVSGYRVGVFGVTVQMFARKEWSQPLCDYWFEPPLEEAERQVRELRPDVDLLVALTHVGFRMDQQLADRCPQIDLIIGGHSHTRLDAPWRAAPDGVPVVQAGSHGFLAGIASMQLRDGRWRLAEWGTHPLRPPA